MNSYLLNAVMLIDSSSWLMISEMKFLVDLSSANLPNSETQNFR